MEPLALGRVLLHDLAGRMSRDEVVGYLQDYAAVTGYDVAFQQLLHAGDGQLDLHQGGHRVAVVSWLRTWGCRHLRRAGDAEASELLSRWWDEWGEQLPAPGTPITSLDDGARATTERAFDELRDARVGGRGTGSRDVQVVFGDTAAAKVLFVIRPSTFLPWDESTRLAFGWWGGGAAFAELQALAAEALDGLSRRLDIPVDDLPEQLSRPSSTPPKVVDEFLWVRISREV